MLHRFPFPETPSASGALDADGKRQGSSKSVPRRTKTCKEFQYGELFKATNGFSPSNKIGEGGFGCVYKGTIGGDLVAVKQLRFGSQQSESQFLAEVNIISTVHHRHLVSLVGYCTSDLQMLLVYEYVPNGTMWKALHGHGQGKPCMNWVTRMKIALGTAQGLAYLHDGCRRNIIHRDIKSSNILLDNQWEAQVADFGLAKVKDHAQTHVSTRAMGTPGYVAPEYAMGSKLTDKVDVYSFGVVLLELITGKKAIDKTLRDAAGQENLVEWARPHLIQALKTKNVVPLADQNLMGEYDKKEMLTMVGVAAACVRHSPHERPKMARALNALAPRDEDIYQGSIPGYSREFADGESSEDRLKKLNQAAFGSLIIEDSRGDEVSEESGRDHVPRVNADELPTYDDVSLDHARLQERLVMYDLDERQIQGDGDCQFRALSDQLYNTQEHHKFVRKTIVSRLESHTDLYEGHVTMPYSEYLKKMAKSGEWGDRVTLQAAADSYGVKICLITSFKDTSFIEILPDRLQSTKVIYLSFWADVHYNSIYAEGGDLESVAPKKKHWLLRLCTCMSSSGPRSLGSGSE